MPLNDKDKDWIIDRLDSLEKRLRTNQAPIFKNSALNLGIKLGSNKNSEEESINIGILKPMLPKSKPLIGAGISNKKPNNDLSGTNQFTAKSLRGNTNSFVINNSGGVCQNYILAKEAIFTDGTNNIMVSGMNNSSSSNSYAQKQKAEATKKHNNFITSTLKDLRSNSYDIAKTLKKMDLFTMLKFAGLAAVLTGAAGILVWIKEKGFGEVVKTILDGVHNIFKSIHLNKEGVEKANKATFQLPYSVSLSSINAKDEISHINKDLFDASNEFKIGETKTTKKKLFDNNRDVVNNMRKAGDINKNLSEFLKSASDLTNDRLSVGSVSNYENSKGLSKFSLPVKCIIVKTKVIDEDNGIGILVGTAKKLTKATTVNQANYILVTGVNKLMVPKMQIIPENTLIALLGANGQIFGDLNQFIEASKLEETVNANNQSETIDSNWIDFKNQKGMSKKYDDTYNDMAKDLNLVLEKEKFKDNALVYTENAIDYAKENNPVTWAQDTAETISSNVNNALNQAQKAKPQTGTTKQVTGQIVAPNSGTGSINSNKGSSNVTNFADPNPDATARSSNRNAVIGTG